MRKEDDKIPPALTPEQFETFQEALAGRRAVRAWLVVLGRHEVLPNEKRIAAFAQAMEIDLYTARQRLLAPTARLLRRETSEKPALQWAKWLREIGFRAFVIEEKDITSQTFDIVRNLRLHKEFLELRLADEQIVALPYKDICCLVFGEIHERTVKDKVRRGWLWDSDTGGERSPARSEGLLDIHFRSTPVVFRIPQDTFQFGDLFPEETGATAVLIRKVFAEIREASPHAAVFESFSVAENVLGASFQLLSKETTVALNWRQPGFTVQSEQRNTSVESSAPAFDLYSTLARLETLLV